MEFPDWTMQQWWAQALLPLLLIVLKILILVVPLLICVAMLTYFERKVIAAMQLRKGPNVVGFWGLLQPFADGLKLLLKETILPTQANKAVFIIAPMLTFSLALLGLGSDPDVAGFRHRQYQCGHPLSLRYLVAGRLRHHHGRLGEQLEIRLPRRHPLKRADGEL